MAPPVKSLPSEPAGTWEGFQRLRPVGVLDDAGEVLERVNGPAFLTLIHEGGNPNHPRRADIQIGVLRLLRDFANRLHPLDVEIAKTAIAHSRFLDPPRERPAAGTTGALPIRVEPPGTRRPRKSSGGGGNVLWEGGIERSGPSFLLREQRVLQASDGRNFVWEVEISGDVDLKTWREFIVSAWDSNRRARLANGATLIVHLIGRGRVAGGEAVAGAVHGYLGIVGRVVLQTSALPLVQPLPQPSAEELQAASERLAELRPREAINEPNAFEKPVVQRITRLWRRFFANQDQPFISPELWLHLTDRLAKKIVRYLPSLSETTLVALAQRVYEDLVAIRKYVEGKEWAGSKLVLALDRLSAEQMTTLLERYPAGLVYKAVTHSDPISAIEQSDGDFLERAMDRKQQARDLQTAREQLGLARGAPPGKRVVLIENWGPIARAQGNIQRHWGEWYQRVAAETDVPKTWWNAASQVVTWQLVLHADMERIGPPVLDQMARIILGELETLRRVYPSSNPPPLLNRLRTLSAAQILERVWELSVSPTEGGGKSLSVTQLMDETRSAQRTLGVPTWGQKFWYEKVLERWRGLAVGEGVPAVWREYVTKRFTAKMASSGVFARVTTDLVDAVGRNLYRELNLLRRAYPKGENPHAVLMMIDILSAEQILGMVRDYGRAATIKVSDFPDPVAGAKRFQANRPFVEEALRGAGYGDLVGDVIWKTQICFREDHVRAVERALAKAQEWRLHGRGRGKGPPPPPTPPTASAGGGETDSATVVEDSPNGDGGKLERGILDISRGVSGFVTITAPFVGLDVAEHYHLISPGQKTLIVGGLMGAMTYLDRMTPGHLGLLYAPFEMGRITTQEGLKAVGVRETSLWYKAGGTVGAFAGAEGFVTWVGKGAGAKTLPEAHLLGRKVLHDSLLNIGRNVHESLGGVKTAISRGWQMMVQSVPTAAEARLIGAALATGLANLADSLITFPILPLDALRGFPQRRGPST